MVEPRVGEIRADGVAPELRKEWLRSILHCRWSELGQPLDRWRNQVLEALLGITQDTVVFSHFVAINVAVGFALDDDRVTCFRPANCSCTVVEVRDGEILALALGAEDAGTL